ncbi:MAG: hypothetical protein KC635_06025, partial [Myxococcales bacterium]|nr:hypothetical protein [Myxococcales bacterium]MCB9737008.1 hypothetical protein [Deltaproteobacteria bacterium]
MTRRERMAKTLHRIASVHEKQAVLDVSRAEAARQDAERAVDDVERLDREAETALVGDGTLSGMDRELLWAHRTWVRTERKHTAERLELAEQRAAGARDAHAQRKMDLHRTETVRDKVVKSESAEREGKAQRESDDLSSMRWNAGHGE